MTSEHPERADRHGLHKDWERRREQMRDKAREERKNGNKPYDWYSPKPIHFVAWDGESWNPNEEYRLIQNSDGYVLRALDLGRDYLTIHDVLPEITRRRDPNFRTVHVIYAGGFDFNMLFRHETEVIRKGVFGYKGTPGSVWPLDEKWEARYIPRKMLKIRPIGSTRFPHVIYDVWGFFSATGSFLKTLDKWKIRSDPIIAEGKKRREDFSPRTFDIERYNSAETLALKRLMDAFYESLKTLDSIPNIPRLSRIRSYHGAGSLADKILHELKAEHMKNGDFSWDRLELEEGDLMDAFPLDVWKAIWAGKDKDVVVGHGSLRRWIEKAGHVVDYKRKMS